MRAPFYWLRRHLPGLLLLALLCPAVAQAQQVRLSNLLDINIPVWVPGDPDIVADLRICVYRQDTSGTLYRNRYYRITAPGNGKGFYLRSGPYLLPYTIQWNDGGERNPERGSSRLVYPGITETRLTNARIDKDVPQKSDDCSGESFPTARLRIIIRAKDLDAAPDGTYTGILTLILAPD